MTTEKSTKYSQSFTDEGIGGAIIEIEPGKAPGFDCIHAKFLHNCGKYAKILLLKFLTFASQSTNISIRHTKL